MYFYIYDSFLVGKKYSKTVSKIETRLASLGIAGRKHQLSILKSTKEIVNNILKENSPTVVVIGSDKTFCQAAVSLIGSDVVLGFIPTETDSLLASVLGLPVNEYACDVISARRIERVSFGKISGQYFFSSIEFDADKCVLFADGNYQIIPEKVKIIKVINLDLLQFKRLSNDEDFERMASNPKDEYLEVLIGTPGKKILFLRMKEKKDSLFFVKSLKIKPKNSKEELKIKVDQDNRIVKAPAVAELAKEKLKIIVGKDRLI